MLIAVIAVVITYSASQSSNNAAQPTTTAQTVATPVTMPASTQAAVQTQSGDTMPPQEYTTESQTCAQQAQALFNNVIANLNPLTTSPRNYKNHYNAMLGKCFVLIWHPIYNLTDGSYMGSEEDLYDAYDNNKVAEIDFGSTLNVLLCQINGNYVCTSKDFQTFIDSRLESQGN